jgi:hypothetical protein
MFQGTDQREVSQGGDVSCEVRRLEFGEHVTRDACKESRDQRLVRKRRRRKNYSLVQCMHLGKKILKTLLCTNDLLLPVTRNVAGEDLVILIPLFDGPRRSVDSERPPPIPSSEFPGSCSTGAHFGAIGRGHRVTQSSPPSASCMMNLLGSALAAQ